MFVWATSDLMSTCFSVDSLLHQFGDDADGFSADALLYHLGHDVGAFSVDFQVSQLGSDADGC